MSDEVRVYKTHAMYLKGTTDKYEKAFTEVVLKSSYDTLKKENEVLRKKLTVCMEQRDGEIWQPFDSQGSKETIANYNQELESIKE